MATELSIRLERELTFEERSDICTGIDYASSVTGTIGDIASTVAGIPGVGLVASGIAIVSQFFSGGLEIASTAVDCDGLPFEEIKDILNSKFNDIERKLNENTEALKKIQETVSKTLVAVEGMRLEMKQKFKEVLDVLRNSEVAPVIDNINNFLDSFDKEKKILGTLRGNQYVSKLEQEGYLEDFRATKTPLTEGLSKNLNAMLSRRFAVPQSKDDKLALSALRALYYGTEAYIEVMYFLIEKYTYLADYYYKKRDLKKYNNYINSILNDYETFKTYLLGFDDKGGLIEKVYNVIQDAIDKHRVPGDMLLELVSHADLLYKTEKEMKNMKLPVLKDEPATVQRIQFEIDMKRFGNWLNANEVRYAFQYERDNAYSKVGDWSKPFRLNGKNNPTLYGLPPAKDATRLVFRQLGNTTELVGRINIHSQTFTDLDRDFYDVAGEINDDCTTAENLIILDANITAVFEGGRRPIHNAAQSNNKCIGREWILNRDWEMKNMKEQRGYAPIHIAVESQSEEFLQMLFEEEVDINLPTNSGETALHLAVKFGYTEIVKKLLKQNNIDVNRKDKNGNTPLHLAVPMHEHRKGMLEVLLSSNKVKVSEKNKLKLTPFHLAVMMEYDDKFEGRLNILRNRNVNVNEGNGEKMTILHMACIGDDGLQKVKFVLKMRGINANAQTTNNKWTPLHLAIFLRKPDIALELLKVRDIKYDLPDKKNVTPLNAAIATGNTQLVQALLKKDAKTNTVTTEGFTILHTAALRGDKTLFSLLPYKKLDINAQSKAGETPLHLAISRSHTELAKFLLQNNANVDAKSKDNTTPMHLAAMKGNLEILRALVEGNANINAKTKTGKTPLHYAASTGNLNLFRYLVERKADLSIGDEKHLTAFYYAISEGHLNIVKYLIDNRKVKLDETEALDTNFTRRKKSYWVVCYAITYRRLQLVKYFVGTLNLKSCNPIYTAAYSGQLDMVKYMVEVARLDVNSAYDGHKDYVPLAGAVLNQNIDIVKYLISKHANVNQSKSIFKFALETKNLEIVKYLAENGVNLKAKFDDGSNFAFIAAKNCLECLKYLVDEKNIDVNAKNNKGNTILHELASGDYPEVINYLCDIAADRTIKNNNNQKAYDIAKKANKAGKYSCLNQRKKFKRNNNLLMGNNDDNNDLFPTKEFKRIEIRNEKDWNTYENNANMDESISMRDHPLLLRTGGSTESSNPERYLNQHINLNGALMLTDVLMKAAKRQKHKFSGTGSVSDAEAQVLALKVTEKLKTLLNSENNDDNDEQADEEIDLSKIHSDVFKAIKSDKISEIPKILESSLKSANVVNNNQIDELLFGIFFNRTLSVK